MIFLSSDNVIVSLGGRPVEFVNECSTLVNIIKKEFCNFLPKKGQNVILVIFKLVNPYKSTEPLKWLGKF